MPTKEKLIPGGRPHRAERFLPYQTLGACGWKWLHVHWWPTRGSKKTYATQWSSG